MPRDFDHQFSNLKKLLLTFKMKIFIMKNNFFLSILYVHIIYIGSTLPYNEQSHLPRTPIITRSRVVGPLKVKKLGPKNLNIRVPSPKS